MSVSSARRVLRNEAKAISRLVERVNDDFRKIINMLARNRGRIIVTGMGKPGFIAQKVSATLSSTGTPSLYLHPAEALHGDLGRVTKEDVIIAFSNSGETEEIIRLLPAIKKIGAKLIAITGNKKSTLAVNSNFTIDSSVSKEACPMGLAPTTSTTAMLALGDAVAVALLEKKNFKAKDFALFHPGGALGKRLLLSVGDIMRVKSKTPVVKKTTKVKDVLIEITKMRSGAASVVDGRGKLLGIFTDGDLRRHLDGGGDIMSCRVGNVMTSGPYTITPDKLAAEAFGILRDRKIDEIPVVDKKGKLVGLLDVQDLLNAGLV
ncbi:MAG: KpsF/GutQ family sugar-phosphate isomerase [Candidatus Omnitrophica bacterium]|nr:KpsF/GutQ family sugar-phosphate isomerase [Candidatus Omnitrophota bacterium]MBU1127833.1 KpsF/GutQ family sugar-phosphate isomerase [Candidatus Omnitrophota bacterium]MBU1851170.1 KpsF/GutQ family sugar-phosphate isomerase [Candidatus Omnitrophota bacterium]